MAKRRMSFQDACSLVDDDMPDGAYFALAHEMAGMEYGDGFDELAEDDFEPVVQQPQKPRGKFRCEICGRHLKTRNGRKQHRRDAHGKAGA
jgi:hypothetical protein